MILAPAAEGLPWTIERSSSRSAPGVTIKIFERAGLERNEQVIRKDGSPRDFVHVRKIFARTDRSEI
jgi:hypothetical protein